MKILRILLAGLFTLSTAAAAPPNIIVILADDLGYADLGVYGAKDILTPNLDRLAGEGIRFTDFYAESVCTPARAALLTGAYPKRVSLHVAVLPPATKSGLHPNEITIAELLKGQGYATACIGKWHLGLEPPVLPTAQGFEPPETHCVDRADGDPSIPLSLIDRA